MKQSDLISHRLKLQHLNVLVAVAQWASMAKAAKHLGVSQPVVSKVIADLEDLLEVRLFERSPQGVEPTLYGRALLKRSIALFDDLKTSVDEIKFLADPSAGDLRIGSTEPLFAGLVTAVIERLWEQYPRIAFRVVQADGATLINRDLPERRIELAVIPLLAPSLREDLEVRVLYRDTLHVVAGLRSPWARRRKITLADLTAEPWCAPPYETPIGSLLAEAFRARGLETPRLAVASVLPPQVIARLLESGRLLGIMADSFLHFFYPGRFAVKKLPVDLPVQSFAVAVVTTKGRTISPVGQLFIDCAREVTRPLARRHLNSAAQPPVPLKPRARKVRAHA
jgi:DNA-binding transcriptional LysR family regulator